MARPTAPGQNRVGYAQQGQQPGGDISILELVFISYYKKDMEERETINGVPVTEGKIVAWTAEAEAGYDVETLKKRGGGRPGRGSGLSQVVALRLTSEELSVIDARAEREGKTRSEIIRDALAASGA